MLIPVVRTYGHLGSPFNPKCGTLPVVSRSVSSAATKTGLYHRRIFPKQAIPIITRKHLAVSCLSGSLFWNAQLWYPLSVNVCRKVSGCYFKYMRSCHKDTHDLRSVSTETVLREVEHPEAIMLKRRVRFWVRIILHAPMCLKCVLITEYHEGLNKKSLLTGIIKDLVLVYNHTTKFADLGDPNISMTKWVEYVAQFSEQFFVVLAEAVSTVTWSVPQVVANVPDTECHICGKMYHSSDISKHLYKSHGVKNALRLKVAGTRCKCCLKNFWLRPSLMHHLAQRAAKCRQFYMDKVADMEVDEAKELDDIDTGIMRDNVKAGLPKRHSEFPCIRVLGPLLTNVPGFHAGSLVP